MAAEVVDVPYVVEGTTDEPFARKLILHAGLQPGTPYPQGGKVRLLERLGAYARAADLRPWLVLVDRDGQHGCAPQAVRLWRPAGGEHLVLRVVENATEAWAMGDVDACASFFGVPRSRMTLQPESVEDPKRLLIDLCRHSRKRPVREGMPPRAGSGRAVGAAYSGYLIEYASTVWSVERASARCPSLARAWRSLCEAARLFEKGR